MSEKININTADADALATLTGIGPELAQRIVEYRDLEGEFEDVFEMVAVPGISARMVRAFEDEVVLDETGTSGAQSAEDAAQEHEDENEGETDTAVSTPPPAAAKIPEPEPDTNNIPDSVTDDIIIAASTVETNQPQPSESAPPQTLEEAIPDTSERDPMPTTETNDKLPPRSPESEARAQRRGCFSIIAGAVFGAILGATLTLVLLASINQGSLEYNAQNVRLQSRLESEIEQRSAQLDEVGSRLSDAATQEAEINDSIATQEANLAQMEATTEAIDARIAEIAGSAETFNTFLLGLRDIIDEVEPSLPTNTPTTTPTNTAVPSDTPTSTGEATEEAAAEVTPTNTAVRATRTPRPTATALFTTTPAPQP